MNWNVGDRVLAHWSHDVFWYPAVIRAIEGERLYVRFDDGDKEWTTGEHLMAVDVEVGDTVYCRYQGGLYYFPGHVTDQDGERIHVQYDDGDEEWTTVSMVRVTR